MTYIEIGEWSVMQNAAQAVRTAVFVHEQGIAPEDEWDADDATALHAVLFDERGKPVGNARLLRPLGQVAKVGRMAVLREVRGHGCGARLLQALLREARKQGFKEVRLSAQRTAESFYATHGFTVMGEPFEELGIAHIEMRLSLV
ncbi:GNAT family N-acetyltransferase [Limnohabitans sp.]|uniref:GNAT family N-acetyltransferase n=1 Tax=Limnohabitans sp. TaxID=1907725 RepID=UPI00286F86D6|nr:GNAT family N-acetyltransferase [Limnohabitans sp.]